ncbi:MAG: response regulator [Nitrospinae bacterium]|nr:response regulator [Nitrospinota bacterium]
MDITTINPGFRTSLEADASQTEPYLVLIVEDCSQSMEIMGKLFSSQGFQWVGAENGQRALELLRERSFDLVLLDIFMPIMNGYEVLKEVKSDRDLSHIPVIAITGNDSVDSAVKCIRMGADDYLSKPFDPVILKARVSSYLEKKRLRDMEIQYRRSLEEQNVLLEERVRAQVQEITERWKAEEDLKKAKEKAEEETRLKDKFVSLVSHDLRSPLASILGMLKVMDGNTLEVSDEWRREIIRKAAVSCHDLINMIDQLLNISRLKTGSLKPHYRFFESATVVNSVLDSLSFLAEKKGIKLVCEVNSKNRLFADRELFFEVLQNLISNAIKFSRRDDTVTVFTPEGSLSMIAVKDTGVGVSEDILPNLFRHDMKTSLKGTMGERGSGLGLPLCKDIMDAHGGRIWVETNVETGSVFYVSFQTVKPKVMIVDDKEDMRFILRSYIQKLDAEVIEADNGGAALEIINKEAPHLLITDLDMPVMDGFHLLQKVRANPATAKLPIVVVTSNMEFETREKAIRNGADDFFTTPISDRDFIPRVGRFVS